MVGCHRDRKMPRKRTFKKPRVAGGKAASWNDTLTIRARVDKCTVKFSAF